MSFIEDGDSTPPKNPPANSPTGSYSEERIEMTLRGSRKAIDRMVGLLHRHNIISGSEWSRPVPFKNSNEMISVASRAIRVD